MSVLITYSTSNKIKVVSDVIAQRLNADTIEIKDLNRKKGFMNSFRNNFNAIRSNQTEIRPSSIDFSEYDLIFIGSPASFRNPSPAILTLINNCDLRHKDVIIYTTTNASRGGYSVLKTMKDRIEAKGGRIINSFIIRVNNKTEKELILSTLRVIHELDLEIYT